MSLICIFVFMCREMFHDNMTVLFVFHYSCHQNRLNTGLHWSLSREKGKSKIRSPICPTNHMTLFRHNCNVFQAQNSAAPYQSYWGKNCKMQDCTSSILRDQCDIWVILILSNSLPFLLQNKCPLPDLLHSQTGSSVVREGSTLPLLMSTLLMESSDCAWPLESLHWGISGRVTTSSFSSHCSVTIWKSFRL